jgi:hypothetical protein
LFHSAILAYLCSFSSCREHLPAVLLLNTSGDYLPIVLSSTLNSLWMIGSSFWTLNLFFSSVIDLRM